MAMNLSRKRPMKNAGNAKRTRETATIPRSMIVPRLTAAITPKSTPKNNHRTRAAIEIESETGKASFIRSLTVEVLTRE
jgi:hypothetical protein